MKTNLSKYILLLSGVTLGLVFYFSNPMTVSADGTPYGEWSGSNSASAGSLQIVPTGYGLTAIGYGSDDHRCTLIIKTAPVNLNTDGQPVVDFGAVTGWQASDCGAGDGDDDFETGRGYGPRVEPISDHYATGWTWGASTDGGLLNNDDFSGNECYYQEYAPLTNIDNRTGWGAAYDGTCNNNGYQRVDLKWVWGAPAGQVIVAVGLSLANDADVSMVGMDTRHAPPTADLSANGSENITVNVGDNIDYVWSSTNGSSASSNYIVTLGSCSPSSGPGVPNDPGVANDLGGSASVTVDSSQAGCTYEITYTVTGFAGTASDTITVTVNSVVFPPVVCSPDSSSTAINTDVTLTAFGGTGTYSWLAPSGTPSSDSGSSFTVRYSSSGPKTVTVTSGLSDTCTVNVSAPSAPTANAGPTHPLTVSTSHTHSGASASDSDGNLASYAWVISNCPSVCPSLSGASGVISGSSASISGPTYTPTAAGNHTLTLTVTDSGGLTGTSSVIEGVCPAVSISGINGQKPPDPEHSGVNTDDTYLIIYGSFSDSGNTVRVDGVPRSPDFQSAAKINVPISLSAGPHTVEVTNQCDNSSGSVSFSVVSVAAPTAPTATLQVRANGTSTWGSSVTVTAPQAVDYQWQSTDAVSATSWYCLNNSTCNEPGDAGWVANSPSNDQLLNQSTAGLS
ncbi:MAG: hypothetical protein Q8P75_03130, partial [bacterium]|nr:hypothetical protein [bacterium]